MKFTGTKDYVATEDLKVAVNAAVTLERPLLVKGEPGTGKTVLAIEVAKALGAPAGLHWHDAEIRREDGGRPQLEVRGTVAARAAALGIERFHLSLSHDAGIASAVVIAESGA